MKMIFCFARSTKSTEVLIVIGGEWLNRNDDVDECNHMPDNFSSSFSCVISSMVAHNVQAKLAGQKVFSAKKWKFAGRVSWSVLNVQNK